MRFFYFDFSYISLIRANIKIIYWHSYWISQVQLLINILKR
ncbi:hypothetical protein IWX84_002314 [Flavobacterium sp. CG_9.10]|nr:hypothetical protein [Flavobacterium sp. CG_9.10]